MPPTPSSRAIGGGPPWRLGHDLVVLGTISKAFGLAGARVGYAIAPAPPTASVLDRLAPAGQHLVRCLGGAGACGLSPRTGWMEEHVGAVEGLLDDLAAGLASLGLDPRTLAAQFRALRDRSDEAGEVADRLMDRGVVVRAFGDGSPVGGLSCDSPSALPDQQERMLEALRKELR